EFPSKTGAITPRKLADSNYFSFERGVSGEFVVAAMLNGQSEIRLAVDTLDLCDISLTTEDWAKAFPKEPPKTVRIMAADRHGTFSEFPYARLPLLKIGSQNYTNLVGRRLSAPKAVSAVGTGFLSRHRVTLDYRNR